MSSHSRMQRPIATFKANPLEPSLPPDKQAGISPNIVQPHMKEQNGIASNNDDSKNDLSPRSVTGGTHLAANGRSHGEAGEHRKEGIHSRQRPWKNLRKLLLISPRQKRKDRSRRIDSRSDQRIEINEGEVSQSTHSLNPNQADLDTGTSTNAQRKQQQEYRNDQESSNNRIAHQTSAVKKVVESTKHKSGAFPTKVVSNLGTFPWRKNMVPEITRSRREVQDSTTSREDHLDLSLIRERVKTKQSQQLFPNEDEISREVRRTGTARLQSFKQRLRVPSFRSRDTRQKVGTYQANVEEATEGPRTDVNVFKLHTRGASSASERGQTQPLHNPIMRTSRSHENQGPKQNAWSPRYRSLRSWGQVRNKAASDHEGLESPWGVKGEVSFGSESMSRQLSRSFFDSIDNALLHVNGIVTAVNHGFKNKTQEDRDSGFSESQEETLDDNKEDHHEGEAIEMFRDAFVEYTTRARQGSNRTFAARLRGKSAIM